MKYSTTQYNHDASNFLFNAIVGDVYSCTYGYKIGNGISMRVKNHYSNPVRFQNDIDNNLLIVDIILPEAGKSTAKNNDFHDDMKMMGGKGFQYEVQDGEDLNDVVAKIQKYINSL